MGEIDALAEQFWDAYLRTLPPAERDRRLFEAFSFGDGPAAANHLADLVMRGVKTATSELLWVREASNTALWKVGDEHIVLDGKGEPVCVVRTTELRVIPFDQVDESFVRDYGEGDGTLAWWRKEIWDHYAAECTRLGRIPTPDMPLICERFELVYPRPDAS